MKVLSDHEKKATVTLEELESIFAGSSIDEDAFSQVVLEMERACILLAVQSSGRTTKPSALAYRYRINKEPLKQELHQRIQKLCLRLHPAIRMDAYFSLSEEEFNEDWPWIELIDAAIATRK